MKEEEREEDMTKKYWSQRIGITAKYYFQTLTATIDCIFQKFFDRCYFQEYYVYYCVDAGSVCGKAGSDISNFIFRKIRRKLQWPLNFSTFDEDTLFDIIELFHDTISFPIDGYFHDYAACGYHYTTFDAEKGQEENGIEINIVIADYENDYTLSSDGVVHYSLTPGLSELTMAKIPSKSGEESKISIKIERTISKYRDRHSTSFDRREALRELADVLEYLRSTLKDDMTTEYEKELVKILKTYLLSPIITRYVITMMFKKITIIH